MGWNPKKQRVDDRREEYENSVSGKNRGRNIMNSRGSVGTSALPWIFGNYRSTE